VDRVDRWLNAQRGWRRLLICWLYFAPVFVDEGLLWSGWGNIANDATVPTGAVLLRVGIAALAGVQLAAVLVRLQMWGRKSRPWAPGFSWRMTVAIYVLMAGMGAQAYGDTRPWAWQHQHLPHRAIFLALAVAGVMLIWNLLYWRRLQRQAEAGAQGPGN
jgi:hypothetical protein